MTLKNQINQQDVFSLIGSITGQKNIIPIPVKFISFTGDLNTAALLTQIIYWTDRTNDSEGYFHKSYRQWENELFLTQKKLQRSVKILKNMGIIKTKVKKVNGDPTLHYQIQQGTFIRLFTDHLKPEKQPEPPKTGDNGQSDKRTLTKRQQPDRQKGNNLLFQRLHTEIIQPQQKPVVVVSDSIPKEDPPPTTTGPPHESDEPAALQETKDPTKDVRETELQELLSLIPENMVSPMLINLIVSSLKAHESLFVRECILYTVKNSNQGPSQFVGFLGKCIKEQWATGYLETVNQAQAHLDQQQENKDLIFLESRRGMPDEILKQDAQNGCWVSAQVLRERSKHKKKQ